jgi:hypothetical protein
LLVYKVFGHPGGLYAHTAQALATRPVSASIPGAKKVISWENGSEKLFKLLTQEGYYPYSDLNREPIA